MTRGNQRELAREKNLKKQKEQGKSKAEDGMSLEQRKARFKNQILNDQPLV